MTYCKENMLVSTTQELEKHKFWITLKNKNVYCFLDGQTSDTKLTPECKILFSYEYIRKADVL